MTEIRILIVEDDPFIAMDIENAVLDRLGDLAKLIVVESVSAAHQAASENDLSCALLDIDVVGGNTFAVAEKLQKNGTPFAFVSGSTPSDVPAQLRRARFVRKPFSAFEIKNFVADTVTARN